MRNIIGVVYTVSFLGRPKDSIGVERSITCEVESKKELTGNEIRLQLYKGYEHIRVLVIDKKEFLKGDRY